MVVVEVRFLAVVKAGLERAKIARGINMIVRWFFSREMYVRSVGQ